MVRITSHMENSIRDKNGCMSRILFPGTGIEHKKLDSATQNPAFIVWALIIQCLNHDYRLKPFDIAEILSVR